MIKLSKILDKDKTHVTLELQTDRQCNGCKSQCGDGMLGFLFHRHKSNQLIVALDKNKSPYYHLIDKKGFFSNSHQVDDIIGIKFNEKQLLKFTTILYGLPIVLIVLSLIVVSILFNTFGFNSDLGGIIGFILGLILARFIIQNSKVTPKVNFFE